MLPPSCQLLNKSSETLEPDVTHRRVGHIVNTDRIAKLVPIQLNAVFIEFMRLLITMNVSKFCTIFIRDNVALN
jgi:hypothetical protein